MLQEKYYLAIWHEYSRCFAKMCFWPRGRDVIYTGCKSHSSFCAWQIYCRYVAVNWKCSHYGFAVLERNVTFATFLQHLYNKPPPELNGETQVLQVRSTCTILTLFQERLAVRQ